MKKKSIFKASFEESLNLEDDAFLQYQLKEQNKKVSNPPKNVFDYFKNALLYGILTLIFPIGFNFLLLAFSTMLYSSDPKDLALPISNHNFLTAHVYVIGLFIWLLFVLIGKFFKLFFILPFFKAFSISFSPSVTVFGLFICWILLNIGLIAMLIFMEFPYFLYAYYKWKYPEEYREWEGKSVEEWYGKRYLKKHSELVEKKIGN